MNVHFSGYTAPAFGAQTVRFGNNDAWKQPVIDALAGLSSGQSLTIGRSAQMSDVVVDKPEVSRRHAQVSRDGNHYKIWDLRSTNGTTVHGSTMSDRINASEDNPIAAQPGARIGLGGLLITLPEFKS